MNAAIETNNLTKYYGTVCAVDKVNLHVKPGEIYGFLGLNGAGKTTTIRAILGMIRPNAGSITVLGTPILPGGRGPWQQVGHLVETPSAYPELSVRENLDIARRLYNVKDQRAVDRALTLLNLDRYANRKAGVLSLGNFQRLGLARALLHDPKLLLLDEPANGLDPAGVVEIRRLLEDLAQERGVTILMCSHILTEVARLAHRIGIIHQGRLVEELDADTLERYRTRRLVVDTRDREAARGALEKAGYPLNANPDGRLMIEDSRAVDAPDEIARLLVQAGAPPIHLTVEQEDLEAYFLRLTGSAA